MQQKTKQIKRHITKKRTKKSEQNIHKLITYTP